MLKQLLTAAVLSASVATMATGSAFADGDEGRDGHGNRWSIERDHRDNRHSDHARRTPSRKIVVERRVHRRVVDGTLPIRRMLDLDRTYTGYRVKSVMVKIKPYRSHGRIKLLVNGDAVDRVRITDDKWITLRTDDDKTIGRGLKSLKLDVRGKVYIKVIKVILAEPRSRRIYSDVKPPRTDRRHPDRTVVNTNRVVNSPIEQILRVILGDIQNQRRSL